MQIQSLRIKSYRSWRVADSASEAAIARMKKLELYEQLPSEGCSTVLCLRAIGWSKATDYRWLRRYRQQGWAGLEACAVALGAPVSGNGRNNRRKQYTICAGVILYGGNVSCGRY